MIAEQLVQEVKGFYVNERVSNPLYVNARNGKLSKKEVINYLINVRFMLEHTPPFLKQARDHALRIGKQDLAAFFAEKIHDEIDHDQWAEGDLERLGYRQGSTPLRDMINPETYALIGYLRCGIEEDPLTYLAYVILIEYLIVLSGGELVANLETQCGISGSMMSVITKHVELDIDHVDHGISAINKILSKEEAVAVQRSLTNLLAYVSRVLARVGVIVEDN